MKETLPILIVGILIISGLGAVAIPDSEPEVFVKADTISLSEPVFEVSGEYLSVDFEESTSMLLDEGKPVIPSVSKTFVFPLGTKIVNTDISSDIKEYDLSMKIQPSPKPVPSASNLLSKMSVEVIPDELVYSSEDMYPSEFYSIKMGAGLKDKEHVLYFTVKCYAQYSPATDVLIIPENIEIKIEYNLPKTSLLTADEYDMLIITDKKFESQLQPLVNHKNNIGVKTILETTDKIYSNYNGRDDPEDIKLRIKDAIEEWGIEYVLLAGGRKGQTFEWYVPDRRTNLDDASGYETGYSSDLYYADIYKYDGSFDDWDSNGNGVFAEFSSFGVNKDIIDYYPDVYVGRIPLRYSWEADIAVNKILTYENSADDSWFKNAYVVSGDTSPPARGNVEEGVYEGELSTAITVDLLEDIGFNVEKLWTSGTWDCKEDVTNAISSGSGFIHFAGHGNPSSWVNFLPDAQTEEEKVDGFGLSDMRKYSNGNKLPIVIVGGCHNAQFNVTMQFLLEGLLEHGMEYLNYEFWFMEWVPSDTCSWFMLEGGGGAIASIGNTGLGYGYVNEFCTEGLGGWINPRFFHAYASQNKEVLGEAHSQAIVDYLNIVFGEVAPGNMDVDRKTIEEWELLGDPSLKIGGI